jgi:trk system potassium uptake protein TrkH
MSAEAREPRGWGLATVLFVIGWELVLLGLAMLVPLFADLVEGNRDWRGFLAGAATTLFFGVLLILTNRRPAFALQLRSVFLLTATSWVAIALCGALPLQLGVAELSLTDAVFETMSGITTTGSTVLVGLDTAPTGLVLWRALLQAMGGVGIIVMAIVFLPFLRVGGMQLFRTESSDRSEKLFPSTAAMVRRILAVYLLLVIACAVALRLCGLSLFDAVIHAFTTISTGGFSTRDSSVAGFANPAAEWVIVLFMLMGGLPFLRLIALLQGRPQLFLRDSQIRLYLLVALAATALLALWLILHDQREWHAALRAAAFNAVSVMTTTGFATEDYIRWGEPAVALFLALTIVGGCTGSTAGGIKMFRFEILWTSAQLYLSSLFLPNRVARPRYAGKPLDNEIIVAVLSFVFFFIGSWGVLTVALGAIGLDLVTAVSGAATALANVGPGLGERIGPAGNFASLPDAAKWLLTFAMLLGRLEFFTVLVLFHPAFWRR